MQVENIQEKINNVYLDMFIKGFTDANIAMLFYYIYNKDFIFDKTCRKWYYLNKFGIYVDDPNNTAYTKKIFALYSKIDDKYHEIHGNENNDETKTKIKKNYTKGYDYIRKAKNVENLISFIIPYFEKDVDNILNNVNSKIIAFKNGVYDLEKNEFRKGLPEEFITITTGYSYEEPKQQYIDEVMKIITSIMPNKENRDYLLKSLSLGLINENLTEEFYIWQGTGGNGKGVISTMMYKTLGAYCGTLDINYLAKTKNGQHANAADPQLASLRFSRLVISTEPEHDINLRTAKLKLLSGKDIVKTRELYGSCFEFTPKFNIIIQTNYAPQIDGTDGGIIRRLRKIHFDMQFVSEPNLKITNQIKGDPELKSKIEKLDYRLAFFKILVDYYKLYVKNGLTMSDGIKLNTAEYLEENDPTEEFIRSKIERTNNKKDKIKSSDMFENFRNYMAERSNDITQAKFKGTMEKKGFILKKFETGNFWINCKFKEDKDDDE